MFAVKQKIGTQAAEPKQRRPDVQTCVHHDESGDKKKVKLTEVNNTPKQLLALTTEKDENGFQMTDLTCIV